MKEENNMDWRRSPKKNWDRDKTISLRGPNLWVNVFSESSIYDSQLHQCIFLFDVFYFSMSKQLI